jgi:hypothetical protein
MDRRAVMLRNIFISYRREENKYQARMIFDAFQKTAPAQIFYDADSIPLGRDFKAVIMGQVQKCDVLIALIGANWEKCVDPKTGLQRLENPNDFVRIEIGTALNRGIPVVPLLIDDAPLPDKDQLPSDLRDLFDRQAEYISFRTFDADVKRLISKLTKIENERQEEIQATSAPQTIELPQKVVRDRLIGKKSVIVTGAALAATIAAVGTFLYVVDTRYSTPMIHPTARDVEIAKPNENSASTSKPAQNLESVASSAEKDDVTAAANAIMEAIGQRDYDKVWDLSADWYKERTKVNKQSFVANWALTRQALGTPKSTSVIHTNVTMNDPVGYQGKIFTVTFKNEYGVGSYYERAVLIHENGKYKLTNFWSAPAQ